MLISYTENKFPREYVPTVFDNYESIVRVEDRKVKFSLWDTAGQEAYARIRVMSYPNCDMILLCFAIDNRNSFNNVEQAWLPEIQHHAPETPFLLIGNKYDLFDADDEKMVKADEGKEMASRIGAEGYLECSALSRHNLNKVFTTALDIVIEKQSATLHDSSETTETTAATVPSKRRCILF
eukprot:TRINITY_DN1515_c0_g1_i2.p1 TRINITY_DN1515_c0_g1~~TRINITY_DN1515_c0_g1_i2.p1  ORF type:complete len:181 (-),score=17.84 TRINITY_DN1515_c0_g1_i2:618-1160(-)